jgi:hypothetical protein
MTILVVGSGELDAEAGLLQTLIEPHDEVMEHYAGEPDALADHIRERAKADVTLVVFHRYLDQFRTEENIRYFASVAATAVKRGCIVIGEPNSRLEAVLQRTARCLDLSTKKHESAGLELHFLKTTDGMTTTNAPSLSLLDAWFGDRLGRLVSANELLAAALTAHFERRGMSLIRIGHCETRTLGYGAYVSRQDMQKTVHIQWGDDPIDEDALLSLPHQMLEAVKNADYIGIQPPNREIVSKNAILENASYVIGRDLKAFSAGARYTNANVHLVIGKSPILFELLKEANRVWLVTGRNVATVLSRHIGRDVNLMQIPAEQKFSDTKPVDPHFTTVFEKVKEQIRSEVQTGDVVLVGAGVLGKVYCSLAKNQGAVALDLGSVFDAWAGLATRGKGFDIPPL